MGSVRIDRNLYRKAHDDINKVIVRSLRNTQLSSNHNLTLWHTNKLELSIFIIDFEKTNEKIKDF